MTKLVWFGMPTCPHCQKLRKYLDKEKIDYTLYCTEDKEGEAKAQEWGITNFPTLFFVKDDVIVDAMVGFNTETQNIREILSSYEKAD